MVSEEDAGTAGEDHYHLGGPGRDKDQPGVRGVHRGGPGAVMDTLTKIQAGSIFIRPCGEKYVHHTVNIRG